MRRALCLVAMFVAGVFCGGKIESVHAQASPNILQITGAYTTHASCTPTVGQPTLCLASDGLWLSINGGVFTQVGTAGVTSVNGKTGAVTISAATVLN
jgi:hypothetical protein